MTTHSALGSKRPLHSPAGGHIRSLELNRLDSHAMRAIRAQPARASG